MNWKHIRKWPAAIIDSLENPAIPFYQYILLAMAPMFVRHFLESFSQPVNLFYLPASHTSINIVHFTLSFFAYAFLLALLTYYVVKVPMERILRVIFPCLMLILLAPILDLIITQGRGAEILYYMPNLTNELGRLYLTFASGYVGASTGLKIEIVIVLTFVFTYSQVKKCSVLRGLFLVWGAYTLMFLWGALPFFIKAVLGIFGYQYVSSSILFLDGFLILNLVLLLWVGYLMNPSVFVALMKDVRGLRILYSELMFLLGVALALSVQSSNALYYFSQRSHVFFALVLTAISIFFAAISAIMTNNLYDINIDKISNPERPLAKGTIAVSLYETLTYCMMGIALFYAVEASGHVLLVIATIISSYYLYSVPPIRFKRVPVLSKIVIGLNSFALVAIGYLLVNGSFELFPAALGWVCFIGFTLAANFIDLKDIQGDKAEGIYTLPIMFGERAAKIILGMVFLLVSVSFYVALPTTLPWFLFAGVGAAYFYLVNKKQYHDWQVILLTNLSIVVIIANLLWDKWR